ncbi:MAG: right-handed parallel beta-helix repeat-containing protein [Actinomycetota bacterium]
METEPDGTDGAAAGEAGDAAPADPSSAADGGGTGADAAVGAARSPLVLDLTSGASSDPAGRGSTSGVVQDGGDGGPEPARETGDDADPGDGTDGPAQDGTATTMPPTTAPASPVGRTVPPSATAPGSDQRALYVDPSLGSSDNPGTEERPFRRPIEALANVEPGTTIFLRGGTYDTSVHSGFSIRRSGTPDQWIRITAYPGERVELVAGGEYESGFEVVGASYVEISGLVIRGRDDSIHGSGVFVRSGSHDVRIVGNQISNFGGAGVSVMGSSGLLIEGNDIRNNAARSFYQGSGITLYKMAGPTNSGFTNVVRGNYLVNNRNDVPHHEAGRITDGNCIIMDRNNETGYQGWTLIENNVCAENGGRGIHSYRSSYIEARNNTLYHNLATDSILHGRGEMTVGEGRDVHFNNNLVINRPGIASYVDNRNTNTTFVNNYVASDPPPGAGNQLLPSGVDLFASTARGGDVSQFRPLGSADLAGSADPSRQATSDFAGRARPSPGTVGAFEP